MTIPSLSVPREQITALPARTPETDGTLTAEQDLTLLKTEPAGNFASVLSSLFPTSSSEDVEKNGDQGELSERSQSDPSNTSLPRNKEEGVASLPTLAPTPNTSPLLLSSLVHTDKNGEQPESPEVSLLPSRQTAIDHPDNDVSSQYVGEGPRRSNNSEQEYSLSVIVALSTSLKASGHRARPNGREAEALTASSEEQRERGISVPESQEKDVLAALTAFPLDQISPAPPLPEQAVQEKHPQVVDTSSLSVGASFSIPSISGDVVAPGGTNPERTPRVEDDILGALAPSIRTVSPGPQLSEPENVEPTSAQPIYEQDQDGPFVAASDPPGLVVNAAPRVIAPYAVTRAIGPSLMPGQQNEQRNEAASAVAPVETVPRLPTNDETQQESVRLSSSQSVHVLNATVFQPEYPSTENDLSVSKQFHGITTSGEPNGQGQPTPTFVNQASSKPFSTYPDGYGTVHSPNIVGEESLRSLTMDSQITDAERFAVRRTRAQDRSPSHSMGLEDLRTHGDGVSGVTPLSAVTQPRATAGPMVIERVAREIAAHIDQGKKKAVIELEPKELGRVQIDLVLEGEKVQVRIVTEAAAASSLIQTHLLELKQALQLHGLELSTVSVDVNAKGEQGNLSYGSQPQLGRHNDNGTGAPGAQAEENAPDIRRRDDAAQSRNGVSVWA